MVMWTKLGAEFPDEARNLSDAAHRTLIDAWCWSNRRGLDLLIPKRDLRRFAETDDPETAIKQLIADGWVEDQGDAWHFGLRFPDWQLPKAVVDHRREQSALTSQRSRLHAIGDHSICLPKNCRAAQTSRDTSRETSPGTERNGTAVTDEPPTEVDGAELDTSEGLCTNQRHCGYRLLTVDQCGECQTEGGRA